jgi:NADPH-dependent curcumin reductase CurA
MAVAGQARRLPVIRQRGSPAKVEWLRSLGVEAFDYRETPLKEGLADGIDVFFDNVGGEQLESALFALRPFGRVVACGAISRYNSAAPEPGPRNLAFIVSKRLRIQGFIVTDHLARFGEFISEVAPLVVGREDAVPRDRGRRARGAPAAFVGPSAATTSARCSSASGLTTRVARRRSASSRGGCRRES